MVRLGTNDPIQVDVRFIAATNKDLEEAVRKHEFRDDLYFRIKGATIMLPPLRQRSEDIPVLIDHMIKKSSLRLNKPIDGIDNDAREILVSYNWPGNIRQLENVIENMIALASGPQLTADDIPPDILGHYSVETVSTTALAPMNLTGGGNTGTAITSLAGISLAELEKEAIQKTLEMVGGNREHAAKLLGIGERTLYRKIKEYGVAE